jgi:hypothetical protein
MAELKDSLKGSDHPLDIQLFFVRYPFVVPGFDKIGNYRNRRSKYLIASS